MRSQSSPRSLFKLARQFSTRIHIERIYGNSFFDVIICIFQFCRTKVGSWLIFFPLGNKKITLFVLLLLLIMKSTIHSSSSKVIILVQLLSIVIQICNNKNSTDIDMLKTVVKVPLGSVSKVSCMDLVRFRHLEVIEKSFV